jgi:uncharacterized membrane protein
MFWRWPFLSAKVINESSRSATAQPASLPRPEDQGRRRLRRPKVTSAILASISQYAPQLVLIFLMLLYFVYTGIYASRRHQAFETNAFDTGVYAQPLWNFSQGNNFSASIIGDNGPLRWATHVEPILFLVAPVYAAWPDPRTLFWLQIAALSLAAIPIFALATRRLGNEWIAVVVVTAFYLMPATEAVTLFDFHAVAFAPLFLLAAIYFLDRALAVQRRSFWLWPESITKLEPHPSSTVSAGRFYLLSAIFFLLALSTKEDISLNIVMIGAYLLFLRRRWQEGGLLMAVGLAWFYIAFQVIIPAFRTGNGQSIYAAWFETLGNTPLEIALSPLVSPGQVLGLIVKPDTLPPLLMITLPMALLPWAGLPLFALAAPSLAFSLLSQNPTLRQLETWHYAAPMLAFVVLGTIDGLARLSHYLSGRLESQNKTGRAKVVLATLAAMLLTSSLVYHFYRGYTPLSQLHEWPAVTAHHRLGREIAASIPPNASVLAQAQLIPYVAHRQELGIWNGPLITDYDYVWIDLSHRQLPNRFDAHGDLLIGLIIEHGFGITTNIDGYLLLQKGAKREVISETLFTFTEFDQLPAQAQPLRASFGDVLELNAVQPEVRRLATSETEPQVILYFDTRQAPAQDYYLFLYLLDQNGEIVGATDYPQPALFWWPTSRWQAGDKRQVRVNTMPWWTGDKSSFGYAIGLSRSDDPWDVSARLPVTIADPLLNPPGVKPIDQDTLLPIAVFTRWAGLTYPKPVSTLNGIGLQGEE